jgi:hypothetical protein
VIEEMPRERRKKEIRKKVDITFPISILCYKGVEVYRGVFSSFLAYPALLPTFTSIFRIG